MSKRDEAKLYITRNIADGTTTSLWYGPRIDGYSVVDKLGNFLLNSASKHWAVSLWYGPWIDGYSVIDKLDNFHVNSAYKH